MAWLTIHLLTFFGILLISGLPIVSAVEDTKDVVEGQQVRLECRFDPSLVAGKATFYWIRSNREEKDNAAIQDSPLADHYELDYKPSEGRYDLIIGDAKYDKDNGEFECKIKRSGSGSDLFSKIIKVVVLIPPGEPQITPSRPIAREGEPFTLTCSSVGGSPDPMISWSRDGQSLNAITRLGESKDVPTSSILTFDPKMEDDLSTYKCVVWNRAVREVDNRNYEKDVMLEVNYIPRVTVGPHSPLQVMEDSTVTLTCGVHAKPPARNVHWMYNGRIISSAYNHTLTYIRPNDRGSYKCVADNGVGLSGEAEIQLQIMYGPKVSVIPVREANKGKTVSVTCDVDAVPKAHAVYWSKKDNPDFRQTGNVLTLRRVSAKDSGDYTCNAVNNLAPYGSNQKNMKTGNATVSVLIEHKPGKTDIFPKGATAIVGKPFTLTCKASPPGWPEPDYTWWKSGEDDNILSTQKTLKFSSINLKHEGKYHCQPRNIRGQGSVGTIVMKVYESARVLSQLETRVVKNESEPMNHVNCRAVGRPVPKVTWLKDGIPIPPSSPLYAVSSSVHKEGSGSFTVVSTIRWRGSSRHRNNILQTDRGVYTCMVDNNVTKPDSSNMNLRIRSPPKVKHTNRRVAFGLNEKAVLECHMQAFPKPNFEWKREKEILGNYGINSRYSTNTSALPRDIFIGKLIIDSVEERDYGDYTCRSWNNIDDTRTILKLVRKGPPDTPTELQMVNVSYDKVALQWKEQFNGGYMNTEFYVRIIDREGNPFEHYSCRRNNPCIVTGLNAQSMYSFSVKATNPAGESQFSEAIQVLTKVNLKSIPEPLDVYFDEEASEVQFKVPGESNLKLFAQVEVLTSTWQVFKETKPLNTGLMTIKLHSNEGAINDVKVRLCLVRNKQMCGHGLISKTGRQVQAKEGSMTLIYMVLIPGLAVVAVIVIILVICCCRRRGKQAKKEYEMDNHNVKPQTVTGGPYYPDTLTKQDQTDGDLKSGIYATNLSGNGVMPNGHLGNGLHYTDSSHLVSTNSSDNQSDLWIKANGSGEIPNGSYQPYEHASNTGYMYPEDYHHLNDEMNHRNRDPYSPPYYDVSGLPDPYQNDEEDKNPQISFDESLESGYSTPNSRNRRVIREIIV